MTEPDKNDCFFLDQMRDPEQKLLNSIAPYSSKKWFTATAKWSSINRLKKLGFLSGKIDVNPDQTFNYENITITDEGKKVLARYLLTGKCFY